MASVTQVCNLAISHLGVGKPIADIATDQSQEATACRVFIDETRDAVLAELHWPFATKIAALNLIETDPNEEWPFSYRYPSDCIEIRRILSGKRNDTQGTREPYKIAKDSAGKIIYADKENSEVEYTERVEDPTFWTEGAILAWSFRLARYLAPRLTAGDPFNLQQRMQDSYKAEIAEARRKVINEDRPDRTEDSELIRVR